MHDDALVQRASARLGTVLCGKYTVDRVLGVGGMAVVYAATHRNRKQVAIKMLHPELSIHSEIHKRFLREGYVANSIKHKGAVDIIDDDVDADGAAFLVMELLDGAPVDAIASKHGGQLPVAAAVAIAYELCGVLAAAHASEIIHRDIKPANLFVTREGELKVLDFGIARLRDASSAQNTNTGMMLGTPAYMAPEQATGKTDEIGVATDIWAVGATLFNLLTGANVHVADTAQLMLIRTATVQARSIGEIMPSLPAGVVGVVDKALSFERQKRWDSAASMRSALRDAYVASFGALASAATLAPLVGGAVKGPSIPAPAGATPSQLAVAATDVGAMAPSAASVHGAPSAAASHGVGATTSIPVSRSFIRPLASTKSIGLIVLLFVLVGGLGLVAVKRINDDSGVTGAAVNGAGMVQGTGSVATNTPLASAAASAASETAPVAAAVVTSPASSSVAASKPVVAPRTPPRPTASAVASVLATSAAPSATKPAPPPTVDLGAVR